jgi:hypothetical protein
VVGRAAARWRATGMVGSRWRKWRMGVRWSWWNCVSGVRSVGACLLSW